MPVVVVHANERAGRQSLDVWILGRQDLGDSRDAPELLSGKRYAMLVTDLPYGIEHTGPGGKRNPLDVVRACAPGWAASLRPGGSAVLVFNRLQPRREALAAVFEGVGLEVLPFAAPHRMSESIERDFLVARQPL